MGWQERVEKYKTEQAEAAKREEEAKLAVLREKTLPLLEALERLHARELLTEIRDEIWKLGEIEEWSGLTGGLTDGSSLISTIQASVKLMACWPVYMDGHYRDAAEEYWEPAHIRINKEELLVTALYDSDCFYTLHKEKIIISVGSADPISSAPERFFPADGPEARTRLEELLVKETASKYGLPYDQRKKEAEPRVIQAIMESDIYPPSGFHYLLRLAEKARLEQPKPPPTISKPPGLLERLFRKQ